MRDLVTTGHRAENDYQSRMADWYQLDAADVCEQLHCDPARGLSDADVTARQAEAGLNELAEAGGRGPWRILWEQISGAMVVLLFVAAGVSLALGEHLDAAAILVIILLNAALGFAQDYRAERALASLKKLAAPTVRVRRNGLVQDVSSRVLVPGDVVLLEAGNFVPADGRLLQVAGLRIQEAALTGESAPVEKSVRPLPEQDVPPGDRHNMAFSGTVVTYGHGESVVTAIGMQTELGRIARMLQTVEREPTPLQRRLAQFGRTLALVALGIVAMFFGIGVLLQEPAGLMLRTALSLAVAVVPEGLPAVATVTLAIGARRMFEQRALIRKLPAVETLGSVTVICSDKTGTLTQNSMTVTVLDVAGERIAVQDSAHQEIPSPATVVLLSAAALCNDAILDAARRDEELHLVGDPTETSLVAAAAHFGLTKPQLETLFPRVDELPFDSDRKRMTTVHRATFGDDLPEPVRRMRHSLQIENGERLAFTKGGVDSLLDVSSHVWADGDVVALDQQWRQRILEANDRLANDGMRVLGVAFKRLPDGDKPITEEIEQELIFVGMEGMIDPPRTEAQEAVARCRTAGIRPLMITGDHPLTAGNIARQLDLDHDGDVLTGRDLSAMSPEDLDVAVRDVSIYARVTPEHKLRIVQALQRQNQIVAMTGDGVNDAPALQQAEIGVAMGITGTDVAREASEMVLLDDNFASIVNAVEQGRIVYDNIRKFVKYTMTSNAGEIWVMLFGPLLGMPLPLLPLQILWVNLVTDGLPGLALGVEPAERDTMQRPPRPPGERLLDRRMARDIVWVGLAMGIVSIAVGYWFYAVPEVDTSYWRTVVFTVLTLSQMGNALAIRSERDSLFRIGLFSNKALLGSVLLTLALQLAVIYAPPLQRIFRTAPLSTADLTICLVASTIVFVAIEVQKWILRVRGGRAGAASARTRQDYSSP